VGVKFDYSTINQIQQANDIVDIVSEHLSLQKKGKELVGLCPFHTDHRPSMYVNPVKQIFKCFACGAGGDVLKFVQLRENLSFPAAVERLAQRAGIKLEPVHRSRKTAQTDNELNGDPKVVAKVNVWAEKHWRTNLNDDDKGRNVREYLEQRQISVESIEKWGLGLAVESWDNFLAAGRAAGIGDKYLLDAGLIVAKDGGGFYDKFRNRLMFPIHDVTGRVTGFGGRTLGDDPAKYMNTPTTVLFDKSNSLYGLNKSRHEIVSSGTVVVVEGYTDVIMAHQFGFCNVVATLGTSFTSGHGRILRRYAKKIILVFDNDTAGIEAANRALEVCLAQRVDIKLAFVAQGNDPCGFLLQEGAEAFGKVLTNATDVMEFKWQRLIDGFGDSDNLSDRKAAAEEYLRAVAIAVRSGGIDPLTKGLIVSKLSGIIGLDRDQINRQLSRLCGGLARGQSFSTRNQEVVSVGVGLGTGYFARGQQEILEVLLNDNELFSQTSDRISIEQFDVPVLREIAEILFEALGSEKKVSLSQLVGRIEGVQASRVAVELAEVGEQKGNYAKRLEDAIELFARHAAGVEKENLKAALRDNDEEALRRLNAHIFSANRRSAEVGNKQV
jgi:DNA primase